MKKGSNRGKKFSKLKNEPVLDTGDYDTTMTSPSGESISPITKSPWSIHAGFGVTEPEPEEKEYSPNVPMGSLVREEGHIYSLAASGDLLYTGSDSKNIRVWKNQREFSGFKSNSGLVKAIVIAGDRIFTGHQDGKIRVWKVSSKEDTGLHNHRRVGTLPTFKDCFKKSMKPSSYVDAKHRSRWNSLWVKHVDAISCLALSEDRTLLYSASWDRTFKVWSVSNSKCLESVNAHDDAVNAVVSGFEGMVFSGSADGTVKVWRREHQGKGTKHFFSQTLLKEDCAVTAIAVDPLAVILYCGSSDGTVNFWVRRKQFQHAGVLRGHKQAVLCLVIAGKLVLSGSADSAICVWRKPENGSEHVCVSVLKAHTGPVKCLAAVREQESGSRERRWVVYSGSLDKSVKMWRVSEQAPPMMFPGDSSDDGHPNSLPAAPSFAQHGRISAKRK